MTTIDKPAPEQCQWILTYTVRWSDHEVSNRTLFVKDTPDLMWRLIDCVKNDYAIVEQLSVVRNPLYSPAKGNETKEVTQ
jgi:hypothetical protein